jgi:hypothetical protein
MAHTAQSPDQWRDAPRTSTRVRHAGHRLAVVSTIGTDAYGSWGFTIWEEGVCLAGQCNWNWGRTEAESRADGWIQRHPEETVA